MRFVIEIDDTQPVHPDAVWTAVVYQMFDDGRTSDLISDASGIGATPEDAVRDLLDDIGHGLDILETVAWLDKIR